MVNDQSVSERGKPLPPRHGLLFLISSNYSFICTIPQTGYGLCYTSRGALAGTRNISMGPPHEGSIRRSIAPWANTLTTELHLAPRLIDWLIDWLVGMAQLGVTHNHIARTFSCTRATITRLMECFRQTGQTTDRADNRQGRQPTGQTTDRADNRQSRQPTEQTTDRADNRQGRQPTGQTTDREDNRQG